MTKNNEKKYITLNDNGCNFRHLAKIMSTAGYKMNHATCRNQLQIALEMLFTKIGSEFNENVSKEVIEDLKNNQEIHSELSEILYSAYESLKKDGELDE